MHGSIFIESFFKPEIIERYAPDILRAMLVTIEVAVPRLTIRATRSDIARSIVGATGDPIRYPGVICSREGQELFVGSYAPLIVTAGLL